MFVPNKKKIGPSLGSGTHKYCFYMYMKTLKKKFLGPGASFMIPKMPVLDRIIVVIQTVLKFPQEIR